MAREEDGSAATQLIDGNGEFNGAGLNEFIKKVKLGDCGLSYAVVAIMGPQSSGIFFFFFIIILIFYVYSIWVLFVSLIASVCFIFLCFFQRKLEIWSFYLGLFSGV